MSDITEVFDVTGYAGTQNVRIVKIAAPARQTTTAPARSSGHVAAATHSTTTAHKKTAKSAAVHHTAVKPKKVHPPVVKHEKPKPFGEKAF